MKKRLTRIKIKKVQNYRTKNKKKAYINQN